MVEHEAAVREDRRLTRRLRQAKLGLQACMPDLDYGQRRGLDKRMILHLSGCLWVRRHQNVLITGPAGAGKTYVACALAHKACLEDFRVR